MKLSKNFLGFTLVELIVVITIVGILSTVGFVSYSGYLTGARDSNRISQLTKLSDSLQVYSATKNLPLPDDYIEITASGTVIAYQGEIGVDVLETIDFTNGGKDPKDDSYYTYYLTKDRKSMQLMALMEEQDSVVKLNTNKANAATYEDRYPKVYGKKLGILTQEITNTPIQQLSAYSSTSFDVVTETGTFTAHISNEKTITGTGASLMILRHVPLNRLDYIDSLVGYWDMESGNSSNHLIDLTQNVNALVNSNNIELGMIKTDKGMASEFNGSDQRFIGNPLSTTELNLTNNFSVSVWIYPQTYKTVGYYGSKNLIFLKGNSLSTTNYGLQISDKNTISFIERGGSEGLQYTHFGGISDMTQKWTNITFTVQNDTLKLYVNGLLHGTQSIGNIEYVNGIDRVIIGGIGVLETHFNGYIDEIKIFNTVLSNSQIESLSQSH